MHTPEDLWRLSPLLDHAFDLSIAEREIWLALLSGEARALVDEAARICSVHPEPGDHVTRPLESLRQALP